MSMDLGYGQAGPASSLCMPTNGRRRGGVVGITELASRLGTTTRALRYYEEEGLVQVDRDRGGRRQYGGEARARLEMIVSLRRSGIPLAMVRVLVLRDAGAQVEVLKARLETLDEERVHILKTLKRLGA